MENLVKSLEGELQEAREQIDLLLDIIDAADLGIKFAPIISKAITCPINDRRDVIRHEFKKEKEAQELYETRILQLAKLNFDNTTTVELVIRYMSDVFSYKNTDDNLNNALVKREGKCWHLAHFFVDLCKVLGFDDARIVRGSLDEERHVWAYVDGSYYDVSMYITAPLEEKHRYAPIEDKIYSDYITFWEF